jgi:hypothetical protein
MLERLKQALNYFYISFKGYLKIDDTCYTDFDTLTRRLSKFYPHSFNYVTDNKMYMIKQEDMVRVGKVLHVVRFRKWKENIHDCDNFAFEMKAIMSSMYGDHTFGIVFVSSESKGPHVLNCFIDEFMKFNYYEPQTGKMFTQKDVDYEPFLIVI